MRALPEALGLFVRWEWAQRYQGLLPYKPWIAKPVVDYVASSRDFGLFRDGQIEFRTVFYHCSVANLYAVTQPNIARSFCPAEHRTDNHRGGDSAFRSRFYEAIDLGVRTNCGVVADSHRTQEGCVGPDLYIVTDGGMAEPYLSAEPTQCAGIDIAPIANLSCLPCCEPTVRMIQEIRVANRGLRMEIGLVVPAT